MLRFGSQVQATVVAETKTGALHTVDTRIPKYPSIQTSSNEEHCHGFEAIPDKEKENVEKILVLLNKFCVGDFFYHEFTMVMDALPKSYLVKERRDQLNNVCHVTPTPGIVEGTQMSPNNLLTARIRDHFASHPDGYDKILKVNISGDGARMTRNSSFILLSFSLLQAGDDIMAGKGNHTLEAVKGKED